MDGSENRCPKVLNRRNTISVVQDKKLCVLQYPLRSFERPFAEGDIEEVRFKPISNKLEVELRAMRDTNEDDQVQPPSGTSGPCILASTEAPINDYYYVAEIRSGALYLSPLKNVYQMRPSMSILDKTDERKFEQEKMSESDPAAQQAGHDDLDSEVQVKRRETDRQTEVRLHSHAHLKHVEESELWTVLEPRFTLSATCSDDPRGTFD
eukprot:31384-Pelagococcus_subviridis.AAC.14